MHARTPTAQVTVSSSNWGLDILLRDTNAAPIILQPLAWPLFLSPFLPQPHPPIATPIKSLTMLLYPWMTMLYPSPIASSCLSFTLQYWQLITTDCPSIKPLICICPFITSPPPAPLLPLPFFRALSMSFSSSRACVFPGSFLSRVRIYFRAFSYS